jgi:hypothetical protein
MAGMPNAGQQKMVQRIDQVRKFDGLLEGGVILSSFFAVGVGGTVVVLFSAVGMGGVVALG